MEKYQENIHDVNEDAKFGLGSAILYGINVVLGTGILLLPKEIYVDLGPASIVAMLFCTLLVFLLALCFAEVSSYFTKSGGAYQYAKVAFGKKTAFVIGILAWFTVTVVWSASASGLAEILGVTIPALSGKEPFIAGLVIILLVLMNIAGIKVVKFFTVIITSAKVLPMVLVAVVGVFFVKEGIDAGNLTPFVQLSEGQSFASALASTAMTVFYAFVGFESLPIIAGEVKESNKNMPIAILVSLSIVAILYILLILVTIATLGPDLLSSNAPIQDAFAVMVGRWGYWFVSIAAIISLAGLNVGDSTHSPRMLEAVAEDGILPSFIAYKNEKGAPVVSIIITGLIALFLVFTGSFVTLAALSVVFYFFQYIPTALCVIVLRKKDLSNYEDEVVLNSEKQFRIPGGPVIAIIAIIVSLWMILGDSLSHIITAIIGVAISLTLFYIFEALNRNKKTN